MKRPKAVTRRSFLRTVVVSAGAASLGPSLLGCDGGGDGRPPEEVFPQSVASGDPRTDSIVLWTRVLSATPTMPAPVTLELARDAEFSERVELDVSELTASPDHDHCLRVKVTGLIPGSRYYYRFEHDGVVSRTGRFRTADPANAGVPVRFAMLSCQDYSGRYYNTLLRLLEPEFENMTFILHLGDYVYETTSDPQFMMTAPERFVELSNPGEAIELGSGDETFYAARSVDNYRDLYKIYRTDPLLQRLHEQFPFICTWDDHEFSDDSHGATATYSDGQLVEEDMERRLNAEQVWLEYMPVARDLDTGSGALPIDRSTLYPNNQIYRSFTFGEHLTLAVTDYRSYRPDHPIPEDMFPGHVLLSQAQTQAALMQLETDGDIPDAAMAFAEGNFRTYIDLEDATYANEKAALELLLTGGYMEAGVDAGRAGELASQYAQGLCDAAVVVGIIEAGRSALPMALQMAGMFDPADATLERGVSAAACGKTGLVGQLGSRYLVVKDTYDLVMAWRTRVDGNDSYDDALGATQEAWLRSTINDSTSTWKVVGNSVCNTSHVIDLEAFASQLPPEIPPGTFYLNVDEWDGFPERRRRLMNELYTPNNCVLLAGDIHGAFASQFTPDAEDNRAVEITTPAVSSGTWSELLLNVANSVQSIRESGIAEGLIGNIDGLMMGANAPRLVFSRSDSNGVTVVDINEVELTVDFHLLDGDIALPRNISAPVGTPTNYYDDPESLSDQWRLERFRVNKVAGKNSEIIERSE